MAAASIPSTSGTKQSPTINKEDENNRPPTVEELLIQVENHLYKSPEHRASLLIAVWSCLGSGIGCFRNIDNVFRMLYRESAMMILGGHWPKMNIIYKRGLARTLIQYSHSMGLHVRGSEGMCSALVMAVYDPWGDPVIQILLSQEEIDLNLVREFVKSEPHDLLLIRVECLVKANCEEAAIHLLRCCLQCLPSCPPEDECCDVENWRLAFKEWLLRLLFRKRRLDDLVAESSSCSCHDGVRLIRQTFHSDMEDSEPLTETLINLFLVRDLLFQSTYCCTAELMKLWCEFQARKQKSPSEIQEAACKLLVGHASSSAQFYLFVDILWGKFGISLLPLYLEMYIRGLTSDLNFLETARQADNKEYVIEIENHMAAMYFKLSSLFNAINKEIALECLLSAFSLDPTKERLEWIKKLSLQISKEKSIKATPKDDPKHKSCSRNGCPHNCTHHPSASLKRKAVVMCDQAIQVGDDLAGFEAPQPDVIKDSELDNQGSCDMRRTSCDNPDPVINNNVGNGIDVDASMEVVKEDVVGKETDLNVQTSSEVEHLVEDMKISADQGKDDKTLCSVDNKLDLKNNVECFVTSTKSQNSSEVLDSVENCSTHKDKVKSTSFSGHNHISENDKEIVSNDTCFSVDKPGLPVKTDKINHLTVPSECHTVAELVNTSAIDKKEIKISAISASKDILMVDESMKQATDVLQNDEVVHHDNNAKDQINICVNGYRETENTTNQDSKSHLKLNENKVIESDKPIVDTSEPCPEKNEPSTSSTQLIVNESKNETRQNGILNPQALSDVPPEIPKDELIPESPKEANVNPIIIQPRVTRRSEALKNINLHTFSHIVMDSKILGLPSETISDFVVVLESLRNRQLKSSCKWSQVKHLCEDYLENVATLRCTMLNTQANGSVDSEADSISDLTADGFKDFDFHQSNESVVEDPYVNKTHVLKRFMNSDKVADMATYVNLSDIHCPQIPLEKLFYTDHSSSHGGHKKRHKRHRNHENKSPEKLVLKKFRHGSRTERDLIKKKKRKKRKAKKGKGHTKKHCFTHGKITKAYVKNKKKKHKLKKKKDGNSGFISGDYCSDFSSEQLMQLVKEHSNSYSKMPATTSKHPHTSALIARSASSSDMSDEPPRKKRKVSFSKKRGHSNKHRDKHKHVKKSSKRKKTIVVETCGAGFKDVMNENEMGNNLESVKDYSHFVQYSSVKKMEAVQIRRRSVELNLSKVNNKPKNQLPSSNNPCEQNPQLQEFVHQNFESYSPEDIMKMQLMMSEQQPGVSAMSNAVSSANNQAILNYFSAKTTSHLLSVAQASNCVVGSDSETSKSPIPTYSGTTSNVQKMSTVHQKPTNLPPNVKHLIIGANTPYKLASSATATTGSSFIPVSFAGNTYSDVHKYTGTVLTSSAKNPVTVTPPQMTTFTFPVGQNYLGGRLIGNKVVIPLPPCAHGSKTTASTMALVPAVTSTYATLSGKRPSSNVIIVKSGNSTQIIHHHHQQPGSFSPLLASKKQMPIARNESVNPVVTKTVPKIIKQAPKKLTQPINKRTIVKTPLFSDTAANGPTDLAVKKVVVDSSGKLSSIKSQVTAEVPKIDISKNKPTPESLLVQRAIEEAKRAIAESAPERLNDPKRNSKNKKESTEEKILSTSVVVEEQNVLPESVNDAQKDAKIELEKEEPHLQASLESPQILATSSAVNNTINSQVNNPASSIDNSTKTNFMSSPVQDPISKEETSKKENLADCNTVMDVNSELNTEFDTVPVIADEEPVATEAVAELSNVLSPAVVEDKEVNLIPVVIPPTETASVPKSDEASIVSLDTSIVEFKDRKSPQLIKDNDVTVSISLEPNLNTLNVDIINEIDQQKEIPQILDEVPKELPHKLDEVQIECPKKRDEEQKEPLKKIDEQEDELPKKLEEQMKGPHKNSCEQQNELQPISAENSCPALKMSSKAENGASVSEVQTRSFTSISDAVRFSLMDMDDATDSVENQVLQAFQVSHESAPQSPGYDNNSTNDGDASVASTAVILTTPQTTSTTELSVSRVSQRFETSVHASQTEKFTDCQSTVSRTTTWILEDSSLNETSQVLGMQKSPEVDSSGEAKDEERPKKKKKRRDRCDRDLESAHKFWCEICHKGFFSAYNLRRHCRNVHKMDLPKGSSDLPFGPKSSPELSFANNSQCHQQGESSSSEVVTPPRLAYVQQPCVSPKGAEFLLQSPTRENKNQDFSMKVTSSQHTTQMQSSDFQMQTPPRMPSQSSSTHVPNVTPSKDFRLPTSTAASQVQLSPSKMSTASKSPTSPKFQRLPTSCSTPTVPQLAKVSQQISQISLCGQPTLQQQMQLSQLQPSTLMQPLSSVSCQAQQLQVAQCPHFQANKQVVQQSIGQLQLMHHTGQLPQVQHATYVIPKQTQVQPYKKCSATQQPSKMVETEQLQQAAQLAQTQQILANQHLQKLMHLRQNAIVATGTTSQLSLGAGVQGSPSKASAQCFRAQLAAAQQVAAAAAAQLPAQQRNQGTNYSLASHNSTAHQFFSRGQPNQDQSNCPHTFTTQNVVEFSTTGPSYPTIRLSSETNDGLEDLEQFLLENMPWSGEPAVPHGLSQQPGNRPSSADSLTLAIPTSSSQNRAGAQLKNKTSISRPKPRKPVAASCSKNLIGNLGRGVKKKPPPKKASKSAETDCSGLKSDVFLQTSIINQQAHVMDIMQRQCSKGISSDLLSSKTPSKNAAISSINETDSSDSVQCINVNLNPHTKICPSINFSTFPTTEKNMNSFCSADPSNSRLYGEHNKNSFLGQRNLVNKDYSNLGDSTINSSLCDTDPLHAGSAFAFSAKESVPNSRTAFCQNEGQSMCPNRSETSPADFLGQRNIEHCDLRTIEQRNVAFNTQGSTNLQSANASTLDSTRTSVSDIHDLFLGGKTASNNDSAVSVKSNNVDINSKSVINEVNSESDSLTVNKTLVPNTENSESLLPNSKVTVSAKIEKGVIFADDDSALDNVNHAECKKTNKSGDKKQNNRNGESVDNSSSKNVETNLQDNILVTDTSKSKDINFNDVSSKEESNNSGPLPETNCFGYDNTLLNNSGVKFKRNLVENEPYVILTKLDDLKQKIVNGGVNAIHLSDVVNSEIEQKNIIDKLITSSTQKKSDINAAKSIALNDCDKESIIQYYDGQDKHTSHENKVSNGVSHVSELLYSAENENSDGLKRIALRIHKSQDIQIENGTNAKYMNKKKSSNGIKGVKKNSHKKKINHAKSNGEVKVLCSEKTPPLKLDINSNIHNIRMSNIDKKKDENQAQCKVVPLCDKMADETSVEAQENTAICMDSKLVTTPERISPGRLRLRDTPKTSVKRVCPCCVDNGTPKKCRSNGNKNAVKLFETPVQSSKSKPTLKTRNGQNAKNVKAITRSSQRLRSRNNAIS